MSYILDSLKKLEQEKLAQTQPFDMRSALLKAEGLGKKVAEPKKTVSRLIGISAGLCALALAVLLYHRYDREAGSTLPPETKRAAKPSEIRVKVARVNSAQRHEDSVAVAGKPLPGEDIQKKPSQHEARTSIQGNPSVPPVLHQKKRALQVKGMAGPRLPKFTIKAVIFFGEGNPENYIILQDNRNDRLRLKRGEQYMNMELTDILAHKALFLVNNRIFEKEMGD